MTTENPLPPLEAATTPVAPATVPVPPQKHRLNPRFRFEAILIVLSVLLGFGVSEWRQAQVDQELAERVQQNLRTEIAYNRARLEEILPQHQQRKELIGSADVSNPELSGWDVILATLAQAGGGVSRPELRKGAWDAAVSTGALRLLEYELVAELSEIYAAQDAMNATFGMSLTMYQPDTFRPGLQREIVQVFIWTLEELINSEIDLLRQYESHLQVDDEASSMKQDNIDQAIANPAAN
jgi:hypothetical protein